MTAIGPTFGDEVISAGLGGLPFAWGSDGIFCGRERLSTVENAALDAVIAAHNPEVTLPPNVISDRQFFQQLAVLELIGEDEALAAVGPGTMPSTLAGLVATLPAEQQFPAKMLLTGAVEFHRDHPLVPLLSAAFGWSSGQLNDLWRDAALL